MGKAVIKGAGYSLFHTPEMLVHLGATQATERSVNPDSDYLKNLRSNLRSYEEVVNYLPNQVYIGNKRPDVLKDIKGYYCDEKGKGERFGKLGEIMPEKEFILQIMLSDAFGLVLLEDEFLASAVDAYVKHPLCREDEIAKVTGKGSSIKEIEEALADNNEGIYYENKLVGVVKKAHDIDINLNAHTMMENLVVKASAVITAKHLIAQNLVDVSKIGYVIECSEEACGDVNQRGGGNFAKAIAEAAGIPNAGGSDVRAFCAAPAHSLIHAASLVEAGTYENVLVVAGGATAKLGMNGKSHVGKEKKVLEDVLGGFAVLISKNDGVSPVIRTDIVGTHKVSTGGSPQKVTESLVLEPLKRNGLKISDVDRFSVEMQNKDITALAGAGDVPLANYKMIGALAVMNKEIEKAELLNFVAKIGMEGWAPTQGHIPSGVPYCGFINEDLAKGSDLKRAMIIGKGSLFLGRMTNLFDGISLLVEQNDGNADSGSSDNAKTLPFTKLQEAVNVPDLKGTPNAKKIGVTTLGSELGTDMIIKAAEEANKSSDFEVVLIGPKNSSSLETFEANTEAEIATKMEELIDNGTIGGCVTMHYNFDIGISTVGRVLTPSNKELLIATTTGTSDTDRTSAMVKNAIYGIMTAKALGKKKPTVGILNVDNARAVKRALDKLRDSGYDFAYGQSKRADGGEIMRGNDLLTAPVDVMVTDSLSGNILMKMFSSFNTNGSVEETGFGYGPGVGFNAGRIVNIISRASGQPVVTNAIKYCAELAKGNLIKVVNDEKAIVKKAVNSVLTKAAEETTSTEETGGSFEMPAKEVVTAEINGIDILDLDNAVEAICRKGIYAESGMGCTGPIILVSDANKEKATQILKDNGFV